MTTKKTCRNCAETFQITDADMLFYSKVSPIFAGKKYTIPTPTLCPDCRQQRRLAFRNERKLYHRKCDLSGKEIISMYSSDKKIKVYDREVWWSDKWDAMEYGRDFDFDKPFFEQYNQLIGVVPRIALNNKEPENSEYCNFSLQNKNSYLLFTAAFCENTYYSNRCLYLKDCADCSSSNECELCYELIDCEKCYNSKYLQNSTNCSDCTLGYNLRNCQNCFACYNLNNAGFCIENKKYTESEYKKKVAELSANMDQAINNFKEFKKQAVRKYINGINLENSTGDALFNSKNAHDCYEGKKLQDCRFLYNTTNMKDSYDVNNDDNSELIYEAIGSERSYMHCFGDICWFNSNDYYNSLCFNSKNIFGCVGLKKNSYCILNKQYKKEEYEKTVPLIIEHMKKTGEWGEFFPLNISIFAYNETLAQDYFPITKEHAAKMKVKWKETDAINRYHGPKISIPRNIEETSDEITNQILTCEICNNNYKITTQELDFYRKINYPIPDSCPDCRHKARMSMRNPRKLWKRACANCKEEIITSYDPNRPEKILCEKCYLLEIY